MRCSLILAPLVLIATSAFAQTAPPARGPLQVPPQLLDPQLTARVVNTTQALSNALLNTRTGEIEAAAEGRPPTAVDRHRTVRDDLRDSGSDIDLNVQRGIAEAGPKIEAANRALATALPQINAALAQAADQINRAVQNMPRPDYPPH